MIISTLLIRFGEFKWNSWHASEINGLNVRYVKIGMSVSREKVWVIDLVLGVESSETLSFVLLCSCLLCMVDFLFILK